MAEHLEKTADPERGDLVTLDDSEGATWSETPSFCSSGVGTTGISSMEGLSGEKERRDFDDGANALWSLYGKEAKIHDEAQFMNLASDMNGLLIFAGLFSAVLASFLVQSTRDLQVNPADQSVYYQNQSAYYEQQSAYYQQQSVMMLAQIAQQLASIAGQSSTTSQPFTPPTVPPTAEQITVLSASPPPFPTFKPSSSHIRVNALWLLALVFSLLAALIATLIRQWVSSYMEVNRRFNHPLRRARFRQFFFEGSVQIRTSAKQVPTLIHVSLFLFFCGLGDSMLNANTPVGVTTIVPISLCGIIYLYFITTHLKDLQSPYTTTISRPIYFLIQIWRRLFGGRKWRTLVPLKSFETYREDLVMEEKERKQRDVRAIRWLLDNTAAKGELEPLVLAIPGTFNTEWGREVWIDVSSHESSKLGPSESPIDRSAAGGSLSPIRRRLPSTECPPDGTSRDTISRCVRYLFETCKNRSYFEKEEARHRRIRACVEAAATLICCIDFQLDWFGEVGKLVSEIGRIEDINKSPTTTSNPSFVIRWTCLSLVSVQQILRGERLQVLAGYASSGLVRFQSEYGQPDETGCRSAQKIEDRLKTAWKHVEELRQAFEPWTQKWTKEQVEDILRKHEQHISELERIEAEGDDLEDVDWRISLYQEAMVDATHGLARLLPGVSFDEPYRGEYILLSDAFNTPVTDYAPPQLIFPGQRVKALARLGSKLREVLDGQADDCRKEVLQSLKSVDQVPVHLRCPNGFMKRQLWRLQDLRDGGGLAFVIELFLLSFRRLLSTHTLHESNSVFYIGAFKIVTSRWEQSKDSLGTQHILLNIVCDLIVRGRGIFSDYLYPEPLANILVDTLGNMLQGYTGPDEHIRDALQEIQSVDSRNCMDLRLRRRAWAALSRSVA